MEHMLNVDLRESWTSYKVQWLLIQFVILVVIVRVCQLWLSMAAQQLKSCIMFCQSILFTTVSLQVPCS